MARIRTIKPEFFTSEDIVELDPMARLLYIALCCEADKEGRLVWKPKTFKIRYFPADSCEIDALADALVTRGLVCLYGENYAFIPSFKDHQHINPREKESVLPDPKDHASFTRDDASVTVNARAGRKEGKESKGTRVKDAGFDFLAALISKEVSESVAKDFMAARKAKKLQPTETAFKGIASEVEKSGMTFNSVIELCCRKGWGGFEASWVKPEDKQSSAGYQVPDFMRGAL